MSTAALRVAAVRDRSSRRAATSADDRARGEDRARDVAADAALEPRPAARPTRGDLVFIGAAALLTIAFSTASTFPAFSGRFAVLLALTLPGLLALGRLVALDRDRAAMAAAAFLGWAGCSALLSANPLVSGWGQVGKESSFVIWCGLFGMWALARQLSEPGRRLLLPTLLAALTLQAAVAVMDVLVGHEGLHVGLISGRARALAGNSIYLGALMAGAAAAAVAMARRARSARGLVASGVASLLGVFALNLSGARSALVPCLALVGFQIVRAPWRRATLLGAFVLAGLVGSQGLLAAADSNAAAIDRAASGAITGGEGRVQVWSFGVSAVWDSPLIGAGPGGFQRAVQHEYTDEYLRSVPEQNAEVWVDPHNLVVELAVTTGVVGLLLFGLFAWTASRRATGPLLVLAGGIALSWMLQPMVIVTGGVAFIALGASAPAVRESTAYLARRRGARWLPLVAAAAGIVAGGYYAWADAQVATALRSASSEQIEKAAARLPRDAVLDDLAGRAAMYEYMRGESTAARLVELTARATRHEPERPLWWFRLGARQLALGDHVGARENLLRATELQEWRIDTWPMLLDLAHRTGDDELAARALRHVCAVDPAAEPCDD